MTLQISYFAWIRERMGEAEESVDPPPDVATVGALVAWLAGRDERGAHAFGDPARIRAALGGDMVGFDSAIGGGREIALFPPVTGG